MSSDADVVTTSNPVLAMEYIAPLTLVIVNPNLTNVPGSSEWKNAFDQFVINTDNHHQYLPKVSTALDEYIVTCAMVYFPVIKETLDIDLVRVTLVSHKHHICTSAWGSSSFLFPSHN